jgi:group I intron endonuclease
VYIGSSINIAQRLVNHAVDKDTNAHLQNALNKHGLGNFTFAVVEIFKVDPDVSMETNKARLLAMEQKYLKWVFKLPKELS